jgi:hypothetical protein
MSGDVIRRLLEIARADLPSVPDEKWRAIEQAMRGEHGGTAAYIARQAKGTHLARLEAAAEIDADMTHRQVAQLLGVSVRHARRLRQLAKG